MQKELKLKDDRKIKVDMPNDIMNNIDDYNDFVNYVESDMAIECIRRIKRNLIFELEMR